MESRPDRVEDDPTARHAVERNPAVSAIGKPDADSVQARGPPEPARPSAIWTTCQQPGRSIDVTCSLEQFIDRWAQHIPKRYQHTVRSFGLFAPRALCQTAAAMFLLLVQKQRPRPKPRSWALSLRRDFGHDPLRDTTGKRRRWTRRLPPQIYRSTNH